MTTSAPVHTRVLFVAAAPKRDISTEDEFKRMRGILDGIPGIELHPAFCATIQDLQDELIKRDVDIVHLVAHGTPGEAKLEPEGGPWGGSVPASMVVKLLSLHASLRCVVLNACHSASWIREPLGPALIMMNGEVGDAAAVEFSDGFYRGVVAGRSLGDAYEQGRVRVEINAPGSEFDPKFMPDCFGVIGVRSRSSFDPELDARCQFFCDLAPHFSAAGQPDWRAAEAQLRAFVSQISGGLHRYEPRINLDCQSSLALAAGRLLGPRTRVYALTGRPTREPWKPNHALALPAKSPWELDERPSMGAKKLAVSISLSNDTRPLVGLHLARVGVSVDWVDFRVRGGAHQSAVQSADHALALARTLARDLQGLRAKYGVDEIDLFFSAPNAFMFLLGQQGVSLGKLNLHEKVYQEERYVPTLISTTAT